MSNVKIVLLQHETNALANTQMESHFIFFICSANRADTLLSMAQIEQNSDKPYSKHT